MLTVSNDSSESCWQTPHQRFKLDIEERSDTRHQQLYLFHQSLKTKKKKKDSTHNPTIASKYAIFMLSYAKSLCFQVSEQQQSKYKRETEKK